MKKKSEQNENPSHLSQENISSDDDQWEPDSEIYDEEDDADSYLTSFKLEEKDEKKLMEVEETKRI